MKDRVPVEQLLVAPDVPLAEALHVLDHGGVGTALVCAEDGKLVGVLTDGDVRRHLMAGGTLSAPVREAATREFFSLRDDAERHEVARHMDERRFNAIPALDARGRVVRLHTLRDVILRSAVDSWAVVMAGGKGERLGDYTRAIPKPMLPVGGRPILERIVRQLVHHGFRRIFLAVNYLAPMIEDHFGDGSRFHCKIEYLREEKPLGTGGALSLLPAMPTEPLLVMNGDLVTDLNFTRLLAFHEGQQHELTVALREHRIRVPYGVAELDGTTVTAMVEKPSLTYQVNAGVYVLSPGTVRSVPADTDLPITALLDRALDAGLTVGGYRMDEKWIDVGLPDEYARAEKASTA